MGPGTLLVQGQWWVQRTLVGQGSVVGLVDLGGFWGSSWFRDPGGFRDPGLWLLLTLVPLSEDAETRHLGQSGHSTCRGAHTHRQTDRPTDR